MKLKVFVILFLATLNVFAMQQPVRVYDPEQTQMLKSLLNVHNCFGVQPYKRIEELVVMGADPNVIADCGHFKGESWIDRLNIQIQTQEEGNCVSVMIAHGANFKNLLSSACLYRWHSLVILLLNNGVNVHHSSGSYNPLYYAVLGGNSGIIKALLDNGAASDIDKPCSGDESPYSYAKKAYGRSSAMVRLLEKYINK